MAISAATTLVGNSGHWSVGDHPGLDRIGHRQRIECTRDGQHRGLRSGRGSRHIGRWRSPAHHRGHCAGKCRSAANAGELVVAETVTVLFLNAAGTTDGDAPIISAAITALSATGISDARRLATSAAIAMVSATATSAAGFQGISEIVNTAAPRPNCRRPRPADRLVDSGGRRRPPGNNGDRQRILARYATPETARRGDRAGTPLFARR